MQITDDTNDWISRMQGDVGWLEDAEVTDELFDPETNIRRGCYFLAYLRGQFGFDEEALAAYNAGIGRVRNWLQEPGMTDSDGRLITEKIPIAETRNYVRKVLDAAERYREIYSGLRPHSRATSSKEMSFLCDFDFLLLASRALQKMSSASSAENFDSRKSTTDFICSSGIASSSFFA